LNHIKTGWIFSLLLVPALLSAQSRIDSFYTPYDSIQDLTARRMEAQWRIQLNRMEEKLSESIRLSDSLLMELDLLKRRIGPLETDKIRLDGEVKSLQERLVERTRESNEYRQKLHNTLWITGIVFLLLLLISFAYLLFYSYRTRIMLGSIQTRLKQLRKVLKLQRNELHGLPVMRKKRVRLIAAREVKNRLKKYKLKKR
jgi:hypothetical protein